MVCVEKMRKYFNKMFAEGIQIMRTLGNNIAWLLKCLEAGKKAGIEMPVDEEKIKTNFIR